MPARKPVPPRPQRHNQAFRCAARWGMNRPRAGLPPTTGGAADHNSAGVGVIHLARRCVRHRRLRTDKGGRAKGGRVRRAERQVQAISCAARYNVAEHRPGEGLSPTRGEAANHYSAENKIISFVGC